MLSSRFNHYDSLASVYVGSEEGEENDRNETGASWLTCLYMEGECEVVMEITEMKVPGSPIYSETWIKGLEVR